jgi:hypothetical protein
MQKLLAVLIRLRVWKQQMLSCAAVPQTQFAVEIPADDLVDSRE